MSHAIKTSLKILSVHRHTHTHLASSCVCVQLPFPRLSAFVLRYCCGSPGALFAATLYAIPPKANNVPHASQLPHPQMPMAFVGTWLMPLNWGRGHSSAHRPPPEPDCIAITDNSELQHRTPSLLTNWETIMIDCQSTRAQSKDTPGSRWLTGKVTIPK